MPFLQLESNESLHSCDAPIRDVRRCAVAVCKSPSQPKCFEVLRGAAQEARAALKREMRGRKSTLHIPRRRSGVLSISCPAKPWPKRSVRRERSLSPLLSYASGSYCRTLYYKRSSCISVLVSNRIRLSCPHDAARATEQTRDKLH